MNLSWRYIKSYKKNTVALLLSFLLTLGLLSAMLVLLHTNHRLQAIENQMYLSPADLRIPDLTMSQVEKMKKDDQIGQLAVTQAVETYTKGDQTVFVSRGDEAGITMTCTLLEGRIPKATTEVAAEKWVLLNLGIQPKLGQEITITDDSGKQQTVTLVGILSDMPKSKQVGMLAFYSALKQTDSDTYIAFVTFSSGNHLDSKIQTLATMSGIPSKQVEKALGREDMKELTQMDAAMMGLLFLICFVVFYGVYRISIVGRQSQYGMLRAVGMNGKKLTRLILSELYMIYLVAVPVGILLGLLASSVIIWLSGDRSLEIYFYNQRVPFELVIPILPIVMGVLGLGLMIGAVGLLTGMRITRQSIIGTIAGTVEIKYRGTRSVHSNRRKQLLRIHQRMGLKYVLCDKRTSLFVILTISLGASLFYGLYSKASYARMDYEETKEMTFLNGEYAMNVLSFTSALEGLSRESVNEIKNMKQVLGLETASGLPVRVLKDSQVTQDETYYDAYNANLEDLNGYTSAGFDGTDEIYPSTLYGYSEDALEHLKEYVISGSINPADLADDEVIISVMSKSNINGEEMVGYYKEGSLLMNYKVGDTIQMKYRTDLQTGSVEYASLADQSAEYTYKTYKIVAITSFPYIQDFSYSVYPLLITSDKWMQEMIPESHIQSLYVNGKTSMTTREQQRLEETLIQIGNKNGDISTRSLIADRDKNEMLYQKQMIYVFGIAVISLILVLINIFNNLKYRIQTRRAEICIYRSVGMKVRQIRKMIVLENLVFAFISLGMAYVISHFARKYLYIQSGLKAYNRSYQFDQIAFLMVAFLTFLVCLLISVVLTRNLKNENIMEHMDTVD